MHIDRCFCFDRTFRELKTVADATGATSVEDIQAAVDFGHNCKLCHPYVRRMLRTGDVTFDTIVRDEDEPCPTREESP